MALSLQLSEITKAYNGRDVLDKCSFHFEKGGIYALMGENGSGKSTLLRICALLEDPDDGLVIYSDNQIHLQNDMLLKRRITLVLPDIGTFNTTVFNNVAYGLKIRGFRSKEIREKVEAALEFVKLTNKKSQNALTLSSGEMKRMGIARAIVLEPEVLFLDEPTASVDYQNLTIIEEIIAELRQRLDSLIIIATHDEGSAKRIADTIVLLEGGRLIPNGSLGGSRDGPAPPAIRDTLLRV
jgi:tungstate transport system ATP-binding protein